MSWKLSHYVVISDAIVSGKYRAIYSTRTARKLLLATTLVDKILANDLADLSDEVRSQLISCEMLVPADVDELTTIIHRNTTAIAENDTLYYVVQPTAQCQLGCQYCGQQHTSTYLSDELNALIVKRVQGKLAKGQYKHLEIGWFGAEPLLGTKQIEKLTPAFKSLAGEYGCTYQAKVVTNGLNLKKQLFLKLVEWDIKSVEITLDGPAAYHDQRRHTKRGYQTFDLIFNNLQQILTLDDFDSFGTRILIRCNVDINNYAGVPELIELLHRHQLLSKISDLYFEPIHAWGNDAHLASLSKEQFAGLEIDWLIALQQKGFVRDHVPAETKPVVCLSLHEDAEVIDAKGNVYNCSEVPYVPVYEESAYLLENLLAPATQPARPRAFSDWNQEVLAGAVSLSSL